MAIDPHPSLPEFEYIRPATLEEASFFLAGHPNEAHPLLGGTDLLVRMRNGFIHPRYLLDVKHLSGFDTLRYISASEGRAQAGLTLGAAVNMNRLIASPELQEHYPLLVDACRSVASHQLRTLATVVGNLCNASPSADTAGACLAYQGVLQVHGVDRDRREPLATFFQGPGNSRLKPGDIVTGIHFPPPPKGSAGVYLKLGRNKLGDLAIVGVTVLGYPDANVTSGCRFRIVLSSVAPIPLRATQAEDYLAGHSLGPATLREAAKLADAACSPIDDVRGSARYRLAMVRNLTRKGLEEVTSRLARQKS